MKDFIDVRRITKQHETAKALNNVSLTIPEGSLAAIVGKSGCGKTTLLNMIGGLDTPSCGEVYVTGKCITAMKERELSRFRAYSKRAANAESSLGNRGNRRKRRTDNPDFRHLFDDKHMRHDGGTHTQSYPHMGRFAGSGRQTAYGCRHSSRRNGVHLHSRMCSRSRTLLRAYRFRGAGR